MKRLLLLTACVMLTSGTAFAASEPKSGIHDSRIKTVTYKADEVYTLRGHYGYGTTIKFSEFEKIQSISLGASNSWQIVPNNERNLIFIKPVEDKANTNMTVITNTRFYHFELSAHTPQNPRANDIVYELQFDYPNITNTGVYQYGGLLPSGPEASNIVSYSVQPTQEKVMSVVSSVSPSGAEEFPEKIDESETLTAEVFDKPVKADPRGPHANTNYSMKGDAELAPSVIFDDGNFTYIKFADNGDLPSIFSVDKNQEESVLNYFHQDGYLVIDHVGKQFTFRRGDIATCIYNRAFKGDAPVFQGGLNG